MWEGKEYNGYYYCFFLLLPCYLVLLRFLLASMCLFDLISGFERLWRSWFWDGFGCLCLDRPLRYDPPVYE